MKRTWIAAIAAAFWMCTVLRFPVSADKPALKYEPRDIYEKLRSGPTGDYPFELIAEYNFDPLEQTKGEKAYGLESIYLSREYYDFQYELSGPMIEDFQHSTFTPQGGTLQLDGFPVEIAAPSVPLTAASDFVFTVAGTSFEAHLEGEGTKRNISGRFIRVVESSAYYDDYPRNGTGQDYGYSYDQFKKDALGTPSTLNGNAAYRYDVSYYVPEPEYGNMLTILVTNKQFYVSFNYTVPEPTGVYQTDNQHAETKPGEDAGVEMDPGIVHTTKPVPGTQPGGSSTKPSQSDKEDAAKGAAAGAAAAAAAAGGVGLTRKKKKKDGDSDEGDDTGQKTYRMYVAKDFGDAIRKGAKPVRVKARIEECDSTGRTKDALSLTQRIQVTGHGIEIKSAAMEGRYMTALVYVPQDCRENEGSVTFTFSQAGTFAKTVTFRLVDSPRIVFPSLSDDGSSWNLAAHLDEVDLVAGMGGREKLRFVITEADAEPVSVAFSGQTAGLHITPVKDAEYAFTYYAEIENNTARLEKESDIFYKREEREIQIEARMEDGTVITANFTVYLHSDGLCVEARKEDIQEGRLLIDTTATQSGAELGYEKIKPVSFRVRVNYVLNDEQIVLVNPSLRFGKIEDEGRYGKTFTENYRCRLSRIGSADFCWFPEDTLPQPDAPYDVKTVIAFREEGAYFAGELPMRFLGSQGDLPSRVKWEKAYEALRADVLRFGCGDDPQMRAMLRNARNLSKEDLETVRHWVLYTSVQFYQEESDAYITLEQYLSKALIVSCAMTKIGDKAVEWWIALASGNKAAASAIAAFVNPLKNALATCIGEYIAEGKCPESLSAERFFKVLINSAQEAIGDALTGELMTVNPQRMGEVVTAYLVTAFANHYFYGKGTDKGDIWRSFRAAVMDLTLTKFKAYVCEKIKTQSDKLMKYIGEKAGKLLESSLMKSAMETAKGKGGTAFADSVRGFYKSAAHLSQQGYEAAKATREGAIQKSLDAAKEGIDRQVKKCIEVTAEAANAAAGMTLSILLDYLLGEKWYENLETSVDSAAFKVIKVPCEWISKAFYDKYGFTIMDVVHTADWDNSIRVDGGILRMSTCGIVVSIDILKNLEILSGFLFDHFFGWMKDLWNMAVPEPASDPRDGILTQDTYKTTIERQYERVCELRTAYKARIGSNYDVLPINDIMPETDD